MGILDILFPKYCVNCKKLGSYLCADCFIFLSFDTQQRCVICDRQTLNCLTHPFCRGKYLIDGVFSALLYKGAVKKLLYSFKYQPYVTDLQDTLGTLLYESLIQKEALAKVLESKNILVVPIPLHKTKLRKRGYNQAEILAKVLARKLHLSMENVLDRTKETLSQVGLKRDKRKENIAGAFQITQKQFVQEKTILLVDDVVTTGATLLEAAGVLKRAGAKQVFGITLAQDV